MDVRRALKLLDDPDPRGERRIRRRLARSRAERRHRFSRWVSVAALAAAAVVLVWSQPPEPPRTIAVAAGPEAPERLLWSDAVDLTVVGTGSVSGRDDQVVVDWQIGELVVRVEPDSGVRLAVRADEGQVEVTGTAFSVVRDAIGFTAQVARGSIDVRCTDGSTHLVDGPSGPVTCWPTTPGRLLGRADALSDRGSSPEEVRETVDRALAMFERPSDDPIRGELLVRRMRLLETLGEPEAALADASEYVTRFTPRSAEVNRFAASLAVMSSRSCESAMRYLEALRDDPDPAFRWLWGECIRRTAPGRVDTLADYVLDEVWVDRARSDQVLRWMKLLGERP